MSWNVRHRIEFTDINAVYWRLDIEEEDYAGAISKIQATGNPINIEYLAASDSILDKPVKGSLVEFSFYSDTHFQWIHLYSVNDFQFRISIYTDEDTLFWRGYIITANYSEPYDGISYPVTISAADGLGTLKNIIYENNGRVVESQIIFEVLSNINVTSFTEFVNIYETGMDSGVGDSPMDQLYIDTDVLNELTCYEVLEELLKKYNAVIRQKLDGSIVIYRPTELTNETVYGRTFTAATVKSATTMTPYQLIDRSEGEFHDTEGGLLAIQQPLKEVKIYHDYANKKSWLDNWEVKGSTYNDTTGTWENWTNVGAGLNSINDAVKSENDGFNIPGSFTAPPGYHVRQSFGTHLVATDDAIALSLDFGVLNFGAESLEAVTMMLKIKADNNNYWLKNVAPGSNELEWTEEEQYVIVSYNESETKLDILREFMGWYSASFNIPGLPVSDSYTIWLYGPSHVSSATTMGFYKNIRIYSTSNEIIYRKELRLPKWWEFRFVIYTYLFGTTVRRTKTVELIVEREYKATNDINGGVYESGVILGDVVDSGIDNILEQFTGSLAVGTADTLAAVASRFVTDHAAAYLAGGVVVTSNSNVIYFESSNPGVDFTGSTGISNLTGNLDGTVQTTQANAGGTKQKDVITLTEGAAGGTANITCNGLTKESTFDTSLANTALNFYEAYNTDYLAVGVVLTADEADIVFEEEYAAGGFTGLTTIVNTAGTLDGTMDEEVEPSAGTARIDTVTLTGSNGTADITCDGNTEEASFGVTALTPTATWNRRGAADNKELLQIIADEIADVYSRPKQLIQLPIMENSEGLSIDLIGNFQDPLNMIGDYMRCFVVNRGGFDVRNRRWELDLFEIGTGEFITSFTPKYGLLYNWYVAGEINYGIAADGWHVPTKTEFETLQTYLGGVFCANELRETGTTYWNSPNTGATNEVGFNGRGSGQRTSSTGAFSSFQVICFLWSITENAGSYYEYELYYNSDEMQSALRSPKYGHALRPIKDSTTLSHGEEGTYTGNDGKVYPTICIGTQEWLACNLCETKFTNGETIPVVEDNDEWAALTTEACCAYDNDWSNAFEYTEETADSTDITADTTLTLADSTINI